MGDKSGELDGATEWRNGPHLGAQHYFVHDDSQIKYTFFLQLFLNAQREKFFLKPQQEGPLQIWVAA